ncbi:MAG: hypothetical protein KJ726_08745 [Verrucomicrobia bacterium]|nr:hypothetical protein [Verrucomicrobiota bacterium]MBU1910122.1 hypothetical protein [Verrucomicrobiota bacterium]
MNIPAPNFLKRPAQRALLRLAGWRRAQLDAVTWIAITGSCGKTTTKEMFATCLLGSYPGMKNAGSLNGLYAVARAILRTGRRHRFVIQELGTLGPGQIAMMASLLKPQVGVITNIGLAHAGLLGGPEGILREKTSLLQSLPPGGLAMLPRDDPAFEAMKERVPSGVRLLTVALRGEADWRAEGPDPVRGEMDAVAGATGERFHVRLPLPGRHNLANALFAIALARHFGIEAGTIIQALAAFRGDPLRWHEETIAGVRVINDAYNANPVSMRAALNTLAELPVPGAKWLVLGAMADLGDIHRQEHLALGRFVAGGPWDGLILVGAAGPLVAEGAIEAGFPGEKLFHAEAAQAAAQLLAAHAQPGDTVLVKAMRAARLERIIPCYRRATRRGRTAPFGFRAGKRSPPYQRLPG